MRALADVIGAVHESIRRRIELDHPGFHVTQIRNKSETRYQLVDPFAYPPEYVMTLTDPLFDVWAEKRHAYMVCTVTVCSDTSLLVNVVELGVRGIA